MENEHFTQRREASNHKEASEQACSFPHRCHNISPSKLLFLEKKFETIRIWYFAHGITPEQL
jgi:hypothetical protein